VKGILRTDGDRKEVDMSIEQMIVTDREGGKGVDPNRGGGYQVAARSPGLDDKTCMLIHDHCVPLAAALEIPDARQKERAWDDALPRNEPDHRHHPYPAEVLSAFPVAWSYWQLKDDVYVLAQVRYLGWCRADPRPGNFLAHALVFSPQDLAPCGYNPMALSRSRLIRSTDDGVTTSLSVISQFPSLLEGPQEQHLLLRSPYREQAAAMVSCLTEPSESKPLLMCLADWRQAPLVIDALLDLLPPPVRCRTGFCSLAGRNRMEGSPKILAAYGEDISFFNLFPGSYQANADYFVFNFIEGKHIPVRSTRYAALVADALQKSQPERLQKHHDLAVKLKLTEQADWDRLVTVTELDDSGVSLETMLEVISFVAELAVKHGVAAEALTLVRPTVKRLALARNAAQLRSIGPKTAVIVDAAASQKGGAPLDQFRAEVHSLANDALGRGRVQLASAILGAAGQFRGPILLKMLEERLLCGPRDTGPEKDPGQAGGPESAQPSSRPTPLEELISRVDGEDRRELVEMLMEAVQQVLASSEPPAQLPAASALSNSPPPPASEKARTALSVSGPSVLEGLPGRLLVSLFHAASEASMVAEVWNRIGNRIVKPLFGKDVDDVERGILQDLAQFVSAGSCAQASIWLNLTLLRARGSGEEEFCLALERIAAALSHSPDPASLKEALQLARGRLRDPTKQTIAVGRMVEKTIDRSPAEDELFREYLTNLSRNGPQHREKIRCDLASHGVNRPIARDFLRIVLPWDREKGPDRVQHWIDRIFKPYPATLDEVRKQVARELQSRQDLQTVMPLAQRLLVRLQGEQDSGRGYVQLFEALILKLPMAPMSKEQTKMVASAPATLDKKVRARLDVIMLLGGVEDASSSSDWSVAQFPSADLAWQGVRQLEPQDREAAIARCLRTFHQTGIKTPEQAEGLWRMMNAAGRGSAEAVAETTWDLLKNRDAVSAVQAAMAYGQLVLEKPHQAAYADMFAYLVKRFDSGTCALLEQHLERRFCKRDPDYEAGMETLCHRANLALPRWLRSSPPPSSAPREMPEQQEEGEGLGLRRLLRPLGGFFGKARGESGRDKTDETPDGSDDSSKGENKGREGRKHK
jgi:hypothetical protein